MQIPGQPVLRPYAPTDGMYDVNLPSVGKLRRELRAVKRSMGRMDEAMLQRVKQMMTTLPLEFLLAQGGMFAEYVRQRCRNALSLLFAGVWENTTAAAMEKWKVGSWLRRRSGGTATRVARHRTAGPCLCVCMRVRVAMQGLVRAQRAEEAKRLYRFNKGKRRLRDTMTRYFRRIHRGKMSVVWEWWAKRTLIIRGLQHDWASRMVGGPNHRRDPCCHCPLPGFAAVHASADRPSLVAWPCRFNGTSVATWGARFTHACFARTKPTWPRA